ncbi:MAG: hypothetical protein ACE5KH_01815 [Candidatus Geothermarchaeales archaeon]
MLSLTGQGVDHRKAFSYLSLGMTIPLLALVGFIIGREYGEPALGIVLGTLVGIGLFLADVIIRAAREASDGGASLMEGQSEKGVYFTPFPT